ncbi:MAG: toprim domain-containing protein [Candidatus Paceibacterota bacterium]|jgi:recombination protein RecR
MDNLNRLEEIFRHFPGIGPRQAKRFVYYLQSKSPAYIKEFIELVDEVKKSTAECMSCHRFFTNSSKSKSLSHSISDSSATCSICSDMSRDRKTLMIVARDSDFETVEKSGAYNGLYFILGGTVPVLDKEPEKRIRLKTLLEKITIANDKQTPFTEIILSLNTTSDGEHTTDIVKEGLERILKTNSANDASPLVKISILGRGLSTGAELEYVDGETIRNALRNRQ